MPTAPRVGTRAQLGTRGRDDSLCTTATMYFLRTGSVEARVGTSAAGCVESVAGVDGSVRGAHALLRWGAVGQYGGQTGVILSLGAAPGESGGYGD